MDYAQYDALDGVRRGDLVAAVANPSRFAAGERREPTADMLFGSMVDDFLTRGVLPELPEHVRIPASVLSRNGRRQGSAWEAWHAQQKPGATLLTDAESVALEANLESDLASLRMIDANIRRNDYLRALFTAKHLSPRRSTQVGLQFELAGVRCKTLIDLVVDELAIVEIKTTNGFAPHTWYDHVARFGYDVQILFHHEAYKQAHDKALGALWVIIDSRPPHEIEVVVPPDEMYEVAREWCSVALPWFAQCKAANNFTRLTQSELVTVNVPAWWRGKRMQQVFYLSPSQQGLMP